jgi:hypothetical protein
MIMGKWDDEPAMTRIGRAFLYTILMLALVVGGLIFSCDLGDKLDQVEGHGSLSAEAIAVRAETGR